MRIPSSANCAMLYKIGRIFSENWKCDLEVFAVQTAFSEISECEKVSVSTHESKNMANDIGSSVDNLKDMPMNYLAEEVDMFPGCDRTDKR